MRDAQHSLAAVIMLRILTKTNAYIEHLLKTVRMSALPPAVVLAVLSAFLCILLLSPLICYRIGNAFFGGVPMLYNVTLAEHFLTYASYPLLGDAVPYAHYQLSRTYFIQGHFGASLKELEKELEFFPDHWRTYYIKGLTLGYMNRVDEAIVAFGKFIEHKPESWAARNDKAWLQFRIGDIDGALLTLAPVAGIRNNPWVQNTYGTLLLNSGRKEEARSAPSSAKLAADTMTEESWGSAYPGNDPRVYGTGLNAMKHSIEENLKLTESATPTR